MKNRVVAVGLCVVSLAWALPQAGLHPCTDGWEEVFARDLSNVEKAGSEVWAWNAQGELVAEKDKLLFTKKEYGPFVLDLEYRMESGANSGVYIYASDLKDLVPNKIEVQILDDPSPRWKDCTPKQRNGSLYGHRDAKPGALKPTGEWNRMTIFGQGQHVRVVVNGIEVVDEDLSKHTSSKVNPDGTQVPPLHTKPWAEIVKRGRIGLQGRHQGTAVYFRNIRVKEGVCK